MQACHCTPIATIKEKKQQTSHRELQTARSLMTPPPLHVWNGLARPAVAWCRVLCEIFLVIRYVAAPV